jgi:hypothetical protein
MLLPLTVPFHQDFFEPLNGPCRRNPVMSTAMPVMGTGGNKLATTWLGGCATCLFTYPFGITPHKAKVKILSQRG